MITKLEARVTPLTIGDKYLPSMMEPSRRAQCQLVRHLLNYAAGMSTNRPMVGSDSERSITSSPLRFALKTILACDSSQDLSLLGTVDWTR